MRAVLYNPKHTQNINKKDEKDYSKTGLILQKTPSGLGNKPLNRRIDILNRIGVLNRVNILFINNKRRKKCKIKSSLSILPVFASGDIKRSQSISIHNYYKK